MQNNFDVNRQFRQELGGRDRFALQDGKCLDLLYMAWVMPQGGNRGTCPLILHQRAADVLNQSIYNNGNLSPVSLAGTSSGEAAFYGKDHSVAPVLLGFKLERCEGAE